MTNAALIAKYGTHKHGHSLFAPSAAAGWMNCAGFLLANARAGDTAGVEAAYGTVAHSMADEWLKRGVKPDRLGSLFNVVAGGKLHPIKVDEQMLAWVERYVKWCQETPGEHYYEQKVALSDIPLPIPGQSGTADFFACEPGKLTIRDLKTGAVRVKAEGNEQAQLYALGVFMEWDWCYDFQTIDIGICMPRYDTYDTWVIDRKQLLAFRERVEIAAKAAWQENAPRTPSPKACRYCSARFSCPALLKNVDDIMDATFGVYDEEPDTMDARGDGIATATGLTYYPGTGVRPQDIFPLAGFEAAVLNPDAFKKLSTQALSYVLTYRAHIERMFKGMAEEALRRAEKGETLPFQSLKDGRRKWYWSDPSKAEALLLDRIGDEDVVTPRKLISPATARKLLPKQLGITPKQAEILLTSDGSLDSKMGSRTLADLDDERPDVNDMIDEMFEGEDEDEDL